MVVCQLWNNSGLEIMQDDWNINSHFHLLFTFGVLKEHKTKIKIQLFKIVLHPLHFHVLTPVWEYGMKLNGNKTKQTAGEATRLHKHKENFEG